MKRLRPDLHRQRRPMIVIGVVLSCAVLVPCVYASHPPPWDGRESRIEQILEEGIVIEEEEVGMGVTNPSRMVLELDGERIAAVWKPLRPGYYSGYWESYQNEVAAYRLDQFLGLHMVPPTVHRVIARQAGSLQFWVDGVRLYSEVEGKTPSDSHWSHQLANMKLFDNLIYNRDRNAGNFMVDDEWNIVLIDHSRAILHQRKLDTRKNKLPTSFDRQVIARLEQLNEETLAEAMGDLPLSKSHTKGILKRRDMLLELVAERVEEVGEAPIMFN